MKDTEESGNPVSIGEGFRAILVQIQPYKRKLGFLSVLGVISAIASGLVPFVTGKFFDALIALSDGTVLMFLAVPLWFAVLGLWVVVRVVSDFVGVYENRLRRIIDMDLHLGVQAASFVHLLRLPLSYHANEQVQESFSRVQAASWRLTSAVRTVTDVVPQILSILIGIALSYSINPVLASILLGGVVAYLLVLVLLLRGTAELNVQAHKAWAEEWSNATTAVTHVAAVKQSAADDYEASRIQHSLTETVASLWHRQFAHWNRLTLWQRIIVFCTQLAVFAVSVHYVSANVITVGELIALNGYALMFFGPLVNMGQNWETLQNAVSASGRLHRMLQLSQESYRPLHAKSEGPNKGVVEFREVSFRYERSQEDILSGVSFTAEPGQSIAFVGESGVGKSTAISLISGYYFPTEGSVLVDGVDTREWDLLALRSRIAVVPQEVALFNDTIRHNIRYGSFDASDSAVERAAQEAHIHDFILKQEKQYETLVGERGIKLSVGQKQRVAIARAILRNPEFLILDEPTSALDIETEQLITKSLEKLMKGRTTFIIAHRLSTVRKADQILVIKDGAVAEQGNHDELINKKNGIYKKLYELHVGLHE